MIISNQVADDIAASARTLHAAFRHEFPGGGSVPYDAVQAAIPVLLRHELDRAEPVPEPAPEPDHVLCKWCRKPVILMHGRWYTIRLRDSGTALAGNLYCLTGTGHHHAPR